MKRTILAIPIIILLVSSIVVQVRTETFVGSRNSDVYHYPSCHYVDRIDPSNLVYFSSAEDALNQGYRPCEVCQPPVSSAKTYPSPEVTTPTPPATSPTPEVTSPSPPATQVPSPTPLEIIGVVVSILALVPAFVIMIHRLLSRRKQSNQE